MLRHELMYLKKPYWISNDDYFYIMLKDCCDDYDTKQHSISYTEICSERELPDDLKAHKDVVGKYVYCFVEAQREDKCIGGLNTLDLGYYRPVRTFISGICSPRKFYGKQRPISYIVGNLDSCSIMDDDSLFFDKKVLRDTWYFLKSELEQDFENNMYRLLEI